MDNSFIYTICSEERLDLETDEPIEYDLFFGGFSSQYENFRVEIIGMNFTIGFNDVIDRYLIVALDNLSSNGVFSRELAGSSSVLFPITVSSADSAEYITNGNVFFNVDNCRMEKQFKMRILLPSLVPVEAGINYHTAANPTEWFLTMKITPIIE